jgi:hypothetical protein
MNAAAGMLMAVCSLCAALTPDQFKTQMTGLLGGRNAKIVWVDGAKMMGLDTKNGIPRTICDIPGGGGMSPCFTYSGNRIVFNSEGYKIFIVNWTGGTPREINVGKPAILGKTWFDGTNDWVLYDTVTATEVLNVGSQQTHSNVSRVNLDNASQKVHLLTATHVTYQNGPDISADGKTIGGEFGHGIFGQYRIDRTPPVWLSAGLDAASSTKQAANTINLNGKLLCEECTDRCWGGYTRMSNKRYVKGWTVQHDELFVHDSTGKLVWMQDFSTQVSGPDNLNFTNDERIVIFNEMVFKMPDFEKVAKFNITREYIGKCGQWDCQFMDATTSDASLTMVPIEVLYQNVTYKPAVSVWARALDFWIENTLSASKPASITRTIVGKAGTTGWYFLNGRRTQPAAGMDIRGIRNKGVMLAAMKNGEIHKVIVQ